MKTIISEYIAGNIEDRHINKWLEEETIHWHGGDGTVEMWQHLGFASSEQYGKWVVNASYLLELKKQHANNKPELAKS